jgi:PIN domain nuclease of toxin-antitoxin system
MKLLLDTCTFLWIVGGSRSIPERVLKQFADAENGVWLSAASAWEIALKQTLGKLPLPSAAAEFVPSMREHYGITALAIDEESALHQSRLPALHRDPFDRMLVSQAIVHGLTILTPDPLITQYPARSFW